MAVPHAGSAASRYHRTVDGALPDRLRRIFRLIGWNALILLAALVLAAAGAEVYLRITDPRPPFEKTRLPVRLVPGVGLARPPHAEIRHTNEDEFWRISHANSLGFADREPPHPQRAAESCHVTVIGDSFVEALEVPVADKVQVRLEELASRAVLALDVTTSAFGYRATAQINQLAFHDVWARRLSPDVIVLVFVANDFRGNSLPIQAWWKGFHPDYPPWRYARPGPDGEFAFVPPTPSLEELRANELPRLLAEPVVFYPQRLWEERRGGVETALRARSYLADWLWGTLDNEGPDAATQAMVFLARAQWLSRHHFPTFMDGWAASGPQWELLLEENPPPVFREALEATAFALEQFRERAERDGAALVILANHAMGGEGDPWFELLREIAAGIGGGGEFPLSASMTTSSPLVARSRTHTTRETGTGTPPATSGRRRPSSNG